MMGTGMARRLLGWTRRLWPLWLGLAGVVLLLVVLFLPPLLISPYDIRDPDRRFADENSLRSTLAGALAGLAVIAGTVVGALNFAHNRRVLEETQRQNRETAEQNRETASQNRDVLELQRRGQLADR